MQHHKMQGIGSGTGPELWGVSGRIGPGLCRILDKVCREHIFPGPVPGGSPPCFFEVGATQDRRVAAARLVDVDVHLGSPENSSSMEVSRSVVVLDPRPSESDFTCESGYSISAPPCSWLVPRVGGCALPRHANYRVVMRNVIVEVGRGLSRSTAVRCARRSHPRGPKS
jgi:hypothetical protein